MCSGARSPHDAIGVCVQAFAFVLVIVAAVVTPPPMQAAGAHAQTA